MSLENVFILPAEYNDLRDSVRALAEKEIAPFARAVDEEHRYPQEAHNALVKSSLFAAHVPTENGGDGADALATCIIIEEVARACGSASLIPAVNKLGSLPLILGGNKEQKERWLRLLTQGKGFSYCLSESEAGSDASALKTTAVRKGDGWVINGSKKWISNAGESEFYTVIAQSDSSLGSKGITAFVIEKSDPGVSFGAPEKKMGFRGSPTREVYFDNVEVGDDRRIGEVGKGFALAMDTLDHTRITIAAQALGLAQGAFDVAKKYSHERKQFGKEIFDFQGVQFMLADMAIGIESARQLTYAAAAKSERGDKDLRFFSASSKTYATDVAMKVTTDAVQVLGGYGYVSDYPVERMMRDAKLTQIYEGTNQIQRIVIARNLP
ncbi:butyryl-CoA dehydrogenase [Candidatus Planktophila versatilis]|uniref:Butyryl-CoA dehydrogenase n=1 Tax=Candidatus Planktophila versatilis TaxID=1884905 RepID=A0AAC9YV75_9ACTN|nr:acyl-CoA dehydrogenase family protein [Candidatus Planktophila versatilis]ASY18090.1 butyryl-CoA dehydrogenase [Candidatus Planktophila versatilis]ASY22110.1 butyryl-CoA dehydrogenase [Candidatus Planktophila versatilis]